MVEVEFKSIKPRLTVSQNQIKLKLTPGTSLDEVIRLIFVAEQIAAILRGRLLVTARGRFNFHSSRIVMTVGEKQKSVGAFRFDANGRVEEELFRL